MRFHPLDWTGSGTNYHLAQVMLETGFNKCEVLEAQIWKTKCNKCEVLELVAQL